MFAASELGWDFRQTAILFDRDPRFAGEPKYSFRKSFTLAINSIVSFSTVPLRMATYLGLVAAGVAILMALLILYWRLFQPESPVKGYTIVGMAFFSWVPPNWSALASWANKSDESLMR